jgi:alpha-tubulin suppressor-like RCC1 family protein
MAVWRAFAAAAVAALVAGPSWAQTTPPLARPAIAQVALGRGHGCARSQDGQVWCWGANASGQLANGDRRASAQAVAVRGLGDAVDVAAGDQRSCAARRDGSVSCWGDDSFALGLAGRFAGVRRPGPWVLQPETVPGVDGAVQVACGRAHACARRRDGTVWCWGGSDAAVRGLQGGASLPFRPRPVAGLDGARALAVAGDTSCATRADGLWCWGKGVPPDGAPSAAPRLIVATALRAWPLWGRAVCAIDPEAVLRCSVSEAAHLPLSLPAQQADVRDLAVSAQHACLVQRSGLVQCWGSNATAELGDRTTVSRTAPLAVGLDDDITQVAVDHGRSCALGRSGRLWCWGDDTAGGTASGAALWHATPQRVAGLPPAVAVAVSHERSCAVTASGYLACWGRDGQRPQMQWGQPVADWDVRGATDIVLGRIDCVRHLAEGLRCRGRGRSWQRVPWPPGGQPADPWQFAVHGDAVCLAVGGRAAHCGQWSDEGPWQWGPPQVNAPSPSTAAEPMAPAPPSARQVASSDHHVCAVGAAGEVWCWGQDLAGAVGVGRPQLRPRPHEVMLPAPH